MGITKITRNFQITLPRDIRAQRNLHVGDSVLVEPDGDTIRIMKMNDDILLQAFGLWKDMKETGVEYTNRMRRQWRKRS
ncbi:MAG: AbrB/MazE/SpoVT family DNA-binding domain-containing protein [Candidatus Woesearchaeota archaeon]|nr:AbrB/MazE/SpoVT family DNA-binding domain-containing protein [Candidatus Woesearchaeota archaeon]